MFKGSGGGDEHVGNFVASVCDFLRSRSAELRRPHGLYAGPEADWLMRPSHPAGAGRDGDAARHPSEKLAPRRNIAFPALATLAAHDRAWSSARVRDYSCARRALRAAVGCGAQPEAEGEPPRPSLSPGELAAFGGERALLDAGPPTLRMEDLVGSASREERGLPPLRAALPFDVSRHAAAGTHVAQRMQSL